MDGRFPKLRKNAEAAACCLSRYSFLFVMPTLVRGYQRQLEENDMYEPLPEQDSETATRRMTEVMRCESGVKIIYPETMTVEGYEKYEECKVSGARRLTQKQSNIPKLARNYNIFHLLQPVALGLLIRYFRYDSPLSKRDAYLAALGVGMTSIMIPIIHHPYFHFLLKFGLELKTACSGMIMQKVSIFFSKIYFLSCRERSRFSKIALHPEGIEPLLFASGQMCYYYTTDPLL
ncbi:unnamed protein product [Gongylonema pulchrum]|uniref:Transmembrane protein n=1 Tax=Gongylonema pulchrum TaxID=637853 RepID=A0A183E2N4_9BILA|nr:unnamed protein product [Gongylonema pulchrum]